MAIGLTQIHHIQIFVPAETDDACQHFYKNVLGLEEIEKPAAWRKNGGAWYQFGANQLHLSRMRKPEDNLNSQRHICYMVADQAHAEQVLREAGAEIIADDRPFDQWTRFYTRDPGGNFIEIAQMAKSGN